MAGRFLPLFEGVTSAATYPDPNTLGYGAVTTNTTTEKITTSAANNLVTGDVFRVATTAGGLTLGTNYYVYKPAAYATTDFSAALNTTDAYAGTIINLSGSVGNILFYDPKPNLGKLNIGTAFKSDINKRLIVPILNTKAGYERPITLMVGGTFTSVTLDIWLYNDRLNEWVKPTQNTPSYTLTAGSTLYIANTQQAPVYIGLSALTGTDCSVYVDSSTALVR